jgi:hypothetical protein
MLLSALSLAIVGIYYGTRFIRIKNYLLGWEWIILGFSASSMLLAVATQRTFFEEVSLYCDAFSRGVGIPLIATLGFIELFSGRKLPKTIGIILFAGGAAFAWAARTVWAHTPGLEITYLVVGQVFNLVMLYFAYRLFAARITGHGVAILIAMVALIAISLLEGGFIAFPGEATNVLFNWLTLAMFIWSLSFAECFYAYRALERKAGASGAHCNAANYHASTTSA